MDPMLLSLSINVSEFEFELKGQVCMPGEKLLWATN